MGEGKTSVILPLLALRISNGITMAQITVLRSLFRTNVDSFRCLFGMLGRRILLLKYCRNIHFNTKYLLKLLPKYKDEYKGILITIPEHIMSFNLKIRELKYKKQSNDYEDLKCLQLWKENNVQTIMDEADDICHFRNELIYPIGIPELIDGKEFRWHISMAIFESLQKCIHMLYEKYGNEEIEYADSGCLLHASKIRLLSKKPYIEICQFILDDIMDGNTIESLELRNWTDLEKERIIKKIQNMNDDHNDDDDDDDDIKEERDVDFDEKTKNDFILLMNGLLYQECLFLVLTRRFTVNYGIHKSRNNTLMAVPFRAKNTPSERSEYSHPDIAIMYTILSYYHTGLNDEMLNQIFKHKAISNYYNKWLQKIETNTIPKQWKYVNLSNNIQYTQIKKEFSKFILVINFYLNEFVFPVYSKQFPYKLSNSPWNITSHELNGLPIIGFSGTNELNDLYPLFIKQNDMDFVADTNSNLNKILSSPNDIHYLEPNTYLSPKDIHNNINVVLDCGAIIEQSNIEFIREWLVIRTDKKAGIYFDDENRIKILLRNGKNQLYETSQFKNNLNDCITFLDDFHTRGTDMPFPNNSIALISLGKGVTRDKLAQCSMRMRKLGYTHTFEYLLSFDVYTQIDHQINDYNNCNIRNIISGKSIVKWAQHNTTNMINDGVLNWSYQGLAYTQNKDKIIEKEIVSIQELYGNSDKNILRSLCNDNMNQLDKNSIKYKIISKYNKIRQRSVLLSNKTNSNSQLLNQEQEKELEKELEQETQRERPPPQEPCEQKISQRIKQLKDNKFDKNKFKKADGNFSSLYISSDFENVCLNQESKQNQEFNYYEYSRPVNWVLILWDYNVGILLSQFEINYLKKYILNNNHYNISIHLASVST
eukprot:394563_1